MGFGKSFDGVDASCRRKVVARLVGRYAALDRHRESHDRRGQLRVESAESVDGDRVHALDTAESPPYLLPSVTR